MTTPEAIAFERGIHSMLEILLPEKLGAILEFEPPAELRERIDDLAIRSTEGRLSESERAEYAGYVRANKFIAILRRQARQMAGLS